mmetsp:Transcript_3381/g.5690  ORF Transcript_3381/g.5690 Transcript_3381/m.5690 type:complete len:84 (+) Transcript_3381:571-822(+)
MCEMEGRKVKNLLIIAGPNMGVEKVPHCVEGSICDHVNILAKAFVYKSWAQRWVTPAGYFRDVENLEMYVLNSVFLPDLNNER